MLFIHRLLAPILLLGTILIFSGCSAPKNLAWLDDPETVPAPDITGAQDPDLQPVELESETRLDQELEALASTGSWDDSEQNLDPALATDFDKDVLPTPGGPTRHRMGPLIFLTCACTARYSRMRSLGSPRPK